MMFKTHIVIAFLFGLIGITLFHPGNQVLFVSLAVIAGIAPDIDHPKSKLGRWFRPFNFLFEHRGFFHSFLVLPVIGIALFLAGLPNFALPVLVGYKSHLLADLATKEGIMPIHPISRFRIRGFIKTGGTFELLIFLA
ncbi:metal-dependent hydrolase, partial [Candidatus Woesearchaeota archaeon]|nr:metal-dependent hydrolase [Candidatus Woesearchaeota archaeon]